MRGDAYALLQAYRREAQWEHPMLWYTLSWLAALLGHKRQSRQYAAKAEAASPRYCFPARLDEMLVLEAAIERNPSAAKAHYYLGNLYYDKRRYEEAIRCWRRSVSLDDSFSIPWRNLGIAEFNVRHKPEIAGRMYKRAFALAGDDARLLYEWDQLQKRAGLASPSERLRRLQAHKKLVAQRDDLTVELITLLNQEGQSQAALERLSARRFNPWEGGEGLVSAQYVHAHRALGLRALAAEKPADALEHFEAARHYPENLGEGKHLLTLERDLDYFSGQAAQQLGNPELARQYWSAAAAPLPLLGLHSYFQAQAQQALGNREAARAVFSSLVESAQRLAEAEPKIDYFATSLPNMLLFDDDLAKRNRIESLLLSALASHGLGDEQIAVRQLQQLLAEDPNHILAAQMLCWIESAGEAAPESRKAEPAP
jgi:tetratricopeptide (TPR) repeat protein